jgi:general secretion pathway protein D
MRQPFLAAFALLLLASCQNEPPAPPEALVPLPEVSVDSGVAPPRISGPVAQQTSAAQPTVSYGSGTRVALAPQAEASTADGEFTVDFVDADIREIAGTILGTMLQVNYAIDPSVTGSGTIKAARPLNRDQLLEALHTVLAQNGLTLLMDGAIYRVLPAETAAASGVVGSGNPFSAGTDVVALRYASARELATILEPFVSEGGRIAADPGRNVLLVSGDPTAREALVRLIRSFDIDVLAGQSYAIFPVNDGDPQKVAEEVQSVLLTAPDATLAGVVRVIAMPRINAVLVVSTQPRYIQEAKDLIAIINEARAATARSWHVYYVQNGQSSDLERVLQTAFTPKNVTSRAEPIGATTPGLPTATLNAGADLGASGSGLPSGTPSYSPDQGLAGGGAQLAEGIPAAEQLAPAEQPLSQPEAGGTGEENTIRIIANRTNNALLIYATPEEQRVIESMLAKIDIVPLQVRIDATIAEVTLNDNLRYGTQFFFKDGGLQGVLSNLTNGAVGGTFPGFVLAQTSGAVRFALSALQEVTNVRVLSSPQVMVLDNQAARLQVGDLVPYITQTAISTDSSDAPIVNSIAYRETGVILQVVPRVNASGLVSLDISQEVSDVRATDTSTIDSPTFLERKVRSRVVVQDGQTVGLAGLIRDNVAEGNSGTPFLKDVPLVGSLFGTQDNTRTRTELLVLITPHVIHDQRDARALTDDLRAMLRSAGLVPQQLQGRPTTGLSFPNEPFIPRYTE